MVALHNRKLTAQDIWPGGLWTWKQVADVKRQIAEQVAAEGIDDLRRVFEESRRFEEYQRTFCSPGLGQQQQIMKRIYPEPPPQKGVWLTEEECAYLRERLFGANDEIGQAILAKLQPR
jgi:hypothetical protein